MTKKHSKISNRKKLLTLAFARALLGTSLCLSASCAHINERPAISIEDSRTGTHYSVKTTSTNKARTSSKETSTTTRRTPHHSFLYKMNHFFHRVNIFLDDLILKPLSIIYRAIVPPFIRAGIDNFFSNIEDIPVIINDFLQARIKQMGEEVARFLFNTLLGLGGFIDISSRLHIQGHQNDFGITLARYGVPAGPYLVLPLFGPAYLRGSIGKAVDASMSPTSYLIPGSFWQRFGISIGFQGLRYVSLRAKNYELIQSLQESSPDLYESEKSFYIQHRKQQIDTISGKSEQKKLDTVPDIDKIDF